MVESGTELAGRYRLDRRLGVGGMGEVWQARDLKFERDLALRRDVAIKLMHSTLAGTDMLRRFQLEAKILSKLNHPHIVRMLDADWHEGRLFIVMELLAGQDLAALLSGQPRGLPVGRAVELARQLAAGLDVVHRQGIVHRDLKPANLFVLPGNLLKIADFGVARDSSAQSVVTAQGVIMGTWAYIAPERWLGTWAGEPSADLYSMGCILYELLTGETPFVADSMAIIRMHCEEVPQAPLTRNHDIPEPLNKLVLRLLEKDAAARPADAAQVAAALADIAGELRRTAPAVPSEPAGPAMPAALTVTAAEGARLGKHGRAARTGGARVTAPVACLSLSRDHRHFFVLADARTLKHRSYWPSQAWTTWHDMGPLPPGNAAAVAAHAYGDHQKIAVAAGDGVYYRWRVGNPGGGWSAWETVPGLGAPAIDLAFSPGGFGGVVPPGGTALAFSPGGTALAFSPAAPVDWEMFAVDSDETIHRSTWRDAGGTGTGWSAWTDVPVPEGLPVTAIAATCAASPDGHRQDLVAVADGRVWHRERHGAPGHMPDWSDWAPLPGASPGFTDVACSSRSPEHVEVFAVDHRGGISRRDYTERSGWSGWQDLPAPAGERAVAVASTSHPFSPYQKLAVLTAAGHVYHAWRSAFGPGGESGWTPWRDLPALGPA